MENIKICSLNVRGIKNRINRRALFKTLRTHSFDITAMQETYINDVDIKVVEKELRGVVHSASSVGRSKGLITHFSNKINKEDISLLEKTDRIIISKVKHTELTLYVINVYAPCVEQDKILFFKTLEDKIKKHIKRDHWGNILCLGDFNCVLDNELDIISGKKHSERTIKAFGNFINFFKLEDKWREFNENFKKFTWTNKDFSSARRLDYIFSGLSFNTLNMKPEIEFLPFTDHKAVSLEIVFKNKRDRGAGIFKIDTMLFKDDNYIKIITETINETVKNNTNLNKGLVWELIKIHVREKSIKYANFKQQIQKQLDGNNRKEAALIEKEVIKDPSNKTLSERLIQLKNEIEIKIINDTKAASLRAGVKWIEEGEKNNKYFLGLERSRVTKNTINRLKRGNNPDDIITKSDEILEEARSFYSNLYQEENNDETLLNNFDNFKHGLKIKKINENQINFLEQEITVSELSNAIKFMNNGSSPGLDGIPTEFYKVFWDVVKKPLFDSFIYSFNSGKLSLSQRKGVLSLLYKGNDLDKELLKNWRPISLVNSDYKILTKLLSIRIKNVIADLVHENQTGFIKNRNISQTLRELDDIIEREKIQKNSHFLLAVDFEKAFDTISVTFVSKMCQEYGFGESFLRWINVLMNDRISCVKNNGYISVDFEMGRGLRQGCPLSPLLFVLAVELLAIKVRQDVTIKGISINNQSTKIRQYADDTTLLLKDNIDIREVLSRLKEFEYVSGLKINKNKSHLICPGNNALVGSVIEDIEVKKDVKILGVWFDNDVRAKNNLKNWDAKLKTTENALKKWSRRDLSIIGKILILKTFALSNFTYLMQSIGMPMEIMKKFNTVCFRFIWKKDMQDETRTFDKVKRDVMCNDYESGGIKMFDIEKHQDAFYLDWAEKYLKEDDKEWKDIPNETFKHLGGRAVFEGEIQYRQLKGLFTSYSTFWNEVLETWHKYKSELNDSIPQFHDGTVLFNNINISFKNKPLWSPECIKNNVIRIGDVLLNNRLMSYTQFIERYPAMKYPMVPYNIIANAVRNIVGELEHGENEQRNNFIINFGGRVVGSIGRKQFLNMIKISSVPYVLQLWKNKLEVDINNAQWMSAINATTETKLRTLHWKIIHNIYPTNILLSKMKVKENQNCEWCDCTDFMEHFFVECKKVKHLWKEIEFRLQTYAGQKLNLKISDILLGFNNSTLTQQQVNFVNHVILIGKLAVSKFKYGKMGDIIFIFEKEICMRSVSFDAVI